MAQLRRKAKPGDVYREAARLLESGHEHFPCLAVGLCDSGQWKDYLDPTTLAGRFILTMAPGKREASSTRKASDLYIAHGGTLENRSILALCFMAAIADRP